MKVKIKRLHTNAKMPTRGSTYAAGYDLYVTEDMLLVPNQPTKISTGLCFEIPVGFVGMVYPRTSTAYNGVLVSPMLVDADYRGELFIIATYVGDDTIGYTVRSGDRLAQMRLEQLVPTEFEFCEVLSPTQRGNNGYGSTGR